MNKTKLYLGLLCFTALAGLFTITKATGQGNPHQEQHQVVMIGTTAAYHHEEGRYVADGVKVEWVDASPGVPAVSKGTMFSTATAYYMNLGFSYELINYNYHLFRK